MDPPPAETLIIALEQLYALGGLNHHGELTKVWDNVCINANLASRWRCFGLSPGWRYCVVFTFILTAHPTIKKPKWVLVNLMPRDR